MPNTEDIEMEAEDRSTIGAQVAWLSGAYEALFSAVSELSNRVMMLEVRIDAE